MLNDLKLLHAYLGQLIEQAEGGGYEVLEASRSTVLDRECITVLVERLKPPALHACDHTFRRIASGEYECSQCGTITDDLENEQWR